MGTHLSSPKYGWLTVYRLPGNTGRPQNVEHLRVEISGTSDSCYLYFKNIRYPTLDVPLSATAGNVRKAVISPYPVTPQLQHRRRDVVVAGLIALSH